LSVTQNEGDPRAAEAGSPSRATRAKEEPRYVLITQCLQDDLFLNADCRLRLPEHEAARILYGGTFDGSSVEGARRQETIANGPLGSFLRHSIGARMETEDEDVPLLHVINIRDWHERGRQYDEERRTYGMHCEAGTQGAEYLRPLRDYLDPRSGNVGPRSSARTGDERAIDIFRRGRLRMYHIRSDSVFDFGAGTHSELEHCLDFLFYKTTEEIERTRRLPLHGERRGEEPKSPVWLYVAVIGVYTDIKIQTLLMGLRSQYLISNLAVSDALTGSPSLDRHIGALDFGVKVLRVEVIHYLNNLLRFLGLPPDIEKDHELVGATSFADFETYHQDKQRVLAHREQVLNEYLCLSRDRAFRMFRRVEDANRILTLAGTAFLVIAIGGAAYETVRVMITRGTLAFEWFAMMGGAGVLGLLQLVGAFFTKAHESLPRSLANLVKMRLILENHSLKAALARFHLTTPETLRRDVNEVPTQRQISILDQQLVVLEKMDKSTYAALRELGLTPASAAQPNGSAGDADEQAGFTIPAPAVQDPGASAPTPACALPTEAEAGKGAPPP
jgi:hypothetical protein